MKYCVHCNQILLKRHQKRFCSNKCQSDHQYKKYINLWKNGSVDGGMGVTSRGLSRHLRKFLMEKFKNKCSLCGWNKKHPVTQVVPLEIDHIDGNAENNSIKNLRLLCPNCHALTPFFKNLNRGKGRKWRTRKYLKN